MSLTDEQIKLFSSEIIVSDIINYINEHSKEYEQFLEIEKNEVNKDDNRRIKKEKPVDKLEQEN